MLSQSTLGVNRSKVITGIIAIVVVAVVGSYILFGSSSSPKYRLASASLGTVSQSISVSGTLEPSTSQNLGFGSGGKVTSVNVTSGQQVQSGAVLATLDTTSLQAQIASAQASLASAQLKLANDQAAASTTTTSVPQAPSNITHLQNVVSADQAKLSTDQQVEQNACSQSSPSSKSATAHSSSTSGSASSQCTSAQLQFSSDQLQLSTAQQQYIDALSQEISSTKSSSQNQSSQSSASPQAIAADQASVTAAQDNLNVAQANLSGATITAPFSGTVAQVNISPGQQIGSNSAGGGSAAGGSAGGGGSAAAAATPAIILNGAGSYIVQASISDAQINQVKPGDSASIIPAGYTTPISGSVTQITPYATTTAGVTTYPVTLSINSSGSGLFAGASAQVSIVVAQKHQVLTIPTSAIHSVGSKQFVLVQNGKRTVHQTVTTGISGNFSTQVLSGLHGGEKIVLAKITPTVPGTGTGKKGGFGGGGKGGKKALG